MILGGLCVARCNIATTTYCGRKKNSAIILICSQFGIDCKMFPFSEGFFKNVNDFDHFGSIYNPSNFKHSHLQGPRIAWKYYVS